MDSTLTHAATSFPTQSERGGAAARSKTSVTASRARLWTGRGLS